MAEPRTRRDTPEHYNETRAKTPPDDVVRPEVGRLTRWTFVLPLVVLTVVFGLLWVFWLGQPPRPRDANQTGNPTEAIGTAGERTPGGENPDPKPGSTKEELEFRAGKK